METVLQFSAPIWGFFLGTLLFSRVGRWVQAIVTAAKSPSEKRQSIPVAALLHSGPWLLVAVAYWAYHILSKPHSPAWEWFFGATVIAVPVWVAFTIYLHFRGKRMQAKQAAAKNAV